MHRGDRRIGPPADGSESPDHARHRRASATRAENATIVIFRLTSTPSWPSDGAATRPAAKLYDIRELAQCSILKGIMVAPLVPDDDHEIPSILSECAKAARRSKGSSTRLCRSRWPRCRAGLELTDPDRKEGPEPIARCGDGKLKRRQLPQRCAATGRVRGPSEDVDWRSAGG